MNVVGGVDPSGGRKEGGGKEKEVKEDREGWRKREGNVGHWASSLSRRRLDGAPGSSRKGTRSRDPSFLRPRSSIVPLYFA